MTESASLIGWQLLAAAIVALPAVWVIGACAAWVPLLGTVGAAFIVLRVRGARHNGWLTRARVRRLSVHSAVGHAALGALGYIAAYTVFPGSFTLPASAVWLLSPILGAGTGLVALVATLIGGDAAAATLGEWSSDSRLPPRSR